MMELLRGELALDFREAESFDPRGVGIRCQLVEICGEAVGEDGLRDCYKQGRSEVSTEQNDGKSELDVFVCEGGLHGLLRGHVSEPVREPKEAEGAHEFGEVG